MTQWWISEKKCLHFQFGLELKAMDRDIIYTHQNLATNIKRLKATVLDQSGSQILSRFCSLILKAIHLIFKNQL